MTSICPDITMKPQHVGQFNACMQTDGRTDGRLHVGGGTALIFRTSV